VQIKAGQINRLVPGLIEKPELPRQEKSSGASFGDQLTSLLDSVNDLQSQAGESQQALMRGEDVELHDVMIKAEEAGLAMDLLLEVRNRLVDGYKELIRMPV
jgi:flagellar hook-basal body complex protein FliE